MEGLGLAANVIAVVDLSAKVASWCYQYSKDVKNAKSDIDRLQREASNLENVAAGAQKLLEGQNGAQFSTSKQLLSAAVEGREQLQKLEEKLRQKTGRKTMSRIGLRALKWPFEGSDIEKAIADLVRCSQAIGLALQVDQTTILLDIDQKAILRQLPVAGGASFDSHAEEYNATCLPNTRVDLLQEISNWTKDPDAKPIFWLNGMAGTGKSTISRTVAQSFHKTGQLGASFFFKTGEADRSNLSKFFTTIAADLVVNLPTASHHIKTAIENDPAIIRRAIGKQFDGLILYPLTESQKNQQYHPIVLVIDALDECETENDIKHLISIFSQSRTLHFRPLRIFLTSRPELPIRLGFRKAAPESYQSLILHEIPDTVIQQDIRVFLEHRLYTIRDEYNLLVSESRKLPSSWPETPRIESLVKMATPLFIFAATMCRFIADSRCGQPEEQLEEILRFQSQSQESQLDATYLPILNRLIAGLGKKQRNKVLEQFHLIIGSIIVLASPLSTTTLSQVLEIPLSSVEQQLDMLHSVISVPNMADIPVRLLHLSFRDFLLDPEKRDTSPFWIDEKVVHANLLSKCLDSLEKKLKPNLTDTELEQWGYWIKITPENTKKHFSPDVQYACLYWVHHLQLADCRIEENDRISNFLTAQFLPWVEGLSLLGKAYECLGLVKTLQSLLGDTCQNISAFLSDAKSFILTNTSVIDSSPLQLYSSLIMFAPKKSKIRQRYEKFVTHWALNPPAVDDEWSQCLFALEGHTQEINSVAFSHDSALLATASSDCTIRIWDVEIGALVYELHKHELSVNCAVFSHDSAQILSCSRDRTLRVSTLDTGDTRIATLSGDVTGWPALVAFSHDSRLLASASITGIVTIWQLESGKFTHVFDAYREITCIAFSPGSKTMAAGCQNGDMHMWNLESHDKVEFREPTYIDGHQSFGAFSHNLEMYTLISQEKIIICSRHSEQPLKRLECIRANATSFSHDSTLLASSSTDSMARIWRVSTGECVQAFHHPGAVLGTAFSHDSALLASASGTQARIWRVDLGRAPTLAIKNVQSRDIGLVQFSSDSSMVSAEIGNELHICNSITGECIREVPCSSYPIARFSPDSKLLLYSHYEPEVTHILSLSDEEKGWAVRGLEEGRVMPTSTAVSHDSALVVSITHGGKVQLWDTATQKSLQTLEFNGEKTASIHRRETPNAVAFSPRSDLIAASSLKRVRIWRMAVDGQVYHDIDNNTRLGIDRMLIISPNSELVAFATMDGIISIHRIATGECLREFAPSYSSHTRFMVFSPDSELLVVATGADFEAFVGRIYADEPMQRFSIGANPYSLRFDEEGSHILTDLGAVSVQEILDPMDTACHHIGYGISFDSCWITWNGYNIFWLPPEYRPVHSAVSGSGIALNCVSGKVVVLKLSPSLPTSLPDI